jgi:hypothetical protein
MGQLLGALTKTGLQSPGGPGGPPSTTFYGSPADAMNQANAALSKAPGPAMVNAPPTSGQLTPGAPVPNAGPVPGPGGVMPMDPRSQAQIAGDAENVNPPQLATSGGGPQFTTPKTNLPTVVKPSFNEASTDQYGNVKPVSPNSGLTKLGTLMTILRGAAQGGSDALAGGALDAHNGPDHPSAFGLGWGAAKQMPLMRAAAQRQAALAAAQQQKEQAQTAQAFSEAQNKQYVPLRTGAALNVRTGQVVPGTQPPEKPDPNMTPQNLYAVALKDLTDTDPTDPSYPIKQAKVQQLQDGITGLQKQPQSHEPNEWDIRTKAAQGDPTAQAILNGKQKEKQNIRVPRQPTDYDIWKSNPQGWSAYHSAQGDNKGNLTANQRSAIESKYSSDLNKLGQNYQLDPETGMYNAKDGTVATPQDYEQFKDGIANERFNRYLAAGETPPDLSAASSNPSPVSAHGNSQPAPSGNKSVLPLGKKRSTQRPPLASFDLPVTR